MSECNEFLKTTIRYHFPSNIIVTHLISIQMVMWFILGDDTTISMLQMRKLSNTLGVEMLAQQLQPTMNLIVFS